MSNPDGRYSYARAWFSTQKPKVEALARQRERWEQIRHDWPTITEDRREYRRRTRRRRSR